MTLILGCGLQIHQITHYFTGLPSADQLTLQFMPTPLLMTPRFSDPPTALQCTHILDISGLDALQSGKFLQIGTVEYVSKLGVCYMDLPLALIEKYATVIFLRLFSMLKHSTQFDAKKKRAIQ